MKTMNDMNAALANDRPAAIGHRLDLRRCISSLEDCYNRTEGAGMTPDAAAAEWCARNGVSLCTEALASMINRIPWDGRISSDLFRWASAEPSAWDRESANQMNLCTRIHPAHLNQIAGAFVRMFSR